MNSWKIEILPDTIQTLEYFSFIGGKPCIPEGEQIPICELCGLQQSFMLQIAFPSEHVWKGFSLAIFSCTSCADENHFIPKMLDGQLKNADIPKGFLNNYQKNFQFIVFPTGKGVVKDNYKEKVKFQAIELKHSGDPLLPGNKIGGEPNWLLEDEAPATYDKTYSMHFLMQLQSNFKFDLVEDAPKQIELDLMGDQAPSPFNHYVLFIGNAIYLFGTSPDGIDPPLVYAITQVDR